jgi:hypothetical protein
MCTEFILAILYFFTIFFANYFLIKIVKNSLQNTLNWLKILTILKNSKMNEKNIFFSLIQFKKNRNPFQPVDLLDSQVENLKELKQDLLISGNLSMFLMKNLYSNAENTSPSVESDVKNREKKLIFSNQVYLNLLKQQILL